MGILTLKPNARTTALLAVFVAQLQGCASATKAMLTTSLPSHQTNYRKVHIYFQEPPKASRPLALISVGRDGESSTYAMEILKIEAAKIGADALAHVDMSYSTGLFPTLRVQGIAVKYVE